MAIDVKYSCFECGLYEVVCKVNARQPGEDVLVWLKKLSQALADDHARRSPNCRPLSFSNVMIPFHEGSVGTMPS
jgi:hypothetical protein